VGSRLFQWDTDGSYGDWYTAHELGHTFGRPHVGSGCGEGPKDPNFPYPAGQLSGADHEFVGFDVGDPALGIPMSPYSGVKYHDVMSYCPFIWMSDYTYEHLLKRIADEAAALAGPAPPAIMGFAFSSANMDEEAVPQMWLNVIGTVNFTSGAGTIDVLQPLTGANLPAGDETRAEVQLYDADGMMLQSVPARVKLDPSRDEDEEEIGILDTFVALDPNAVRVDLVVGGLPVDSRALKQAGGISFAAADSGLTYTIQVSSDDGPWQTVAVGADGPNYDVRRADFPGARRLRVRVLAFDGSQTTPVREETLGE
jgi:hypothetical protein